MRLVVLILGLALAYSLAAQEQPKKKPAAKKVQAAHKKPTPEQVRKFNELEKKKKE